VKRVIIGAIFFLAVGCKNDKDNSSDSVLDGKESFEPIVQTIDRGDLKKMLENPEKVTVLNFWATWCKPCIEELPEFVDVYTEMGDQIDMRLISLDQAQKIDSVVVPFLKKENIRIPVLVLDDPVSNEWIPMVDPHWDGAIPVTIIYNEQQKIFLEKQVTSSELIDEINRLK
jgi:thiol-disulfide isomerase/thioredoxin